MPITTHNITSRSEFCTVCGKPAKVGREVTGSINGMEIDDAFFFCADHKHLATDKKIAQVVIDMME